MAKTRQQNLEAVQVDHEECAQILDLVISNSMNLLITGAPGVGKTELVEQACKRCNANLEVFHPVISDPTDLKGMPALIKNDATEAERIEYLAKFVPFESLKRLLTAKVKTVAFADDLGQAAQAVQAAWMQLTLARKLDDVQVSDHIIFLGASNRKEDKAGVQGILEPLKSRFHSIVELIVRPDPWLEWARYKADPKIHPYVRAFIRWRPKRLWEFEATNDMTNTPSPRTVKHVSDIMYAKPNDHIRQPLVAGAAGQAFATEFQQFVKVIKSLPQIKYIVKHPDKAPVPKDLGAQYAIVEAMLDKTDRNLVTPFMVYIQRFEKEFQAWFYGQIKEMHPECIKTKAVVTWATKHGID